MKREFAAYLQSALEKKTSSRLLAQELAELWTVNASTAYKKLRGDTTITIDEALLLVQRYGISLDAFATGQSDQVIFRLPSLLQRRNTAQAFIGGLVRFMEAAHVDNASTFIHYATNEVPVFYYLLYPELTAFKMYLWSQSIWGSVPAQQSGSDWITALLQDAAFQQMRETAFNTFATIPSHEFYPRNMLDNTLSQVHFLYETGAIDRAFAQLIIGQITSLVRWLEQAAEQGRKTPLDGGQGAIFTVHHNEIIYSNNIILLEGKQLSTVFCTLDNPNYLISSDDRLVAYTKEWFDIVRHKSVKISADGERHRKAYFHHLQRRIQESSRTMQ